MHSIEVVHIYGKAVGVAIFGCTIATKGSAPRFRLVLT